MSAEPIAWCFRKSLVQKLQWAKPVGGGEVTQHWTPLGDVSGLLAERDRLKAANAELAAALECIEGMYDREASVGSNSLAMYEASCMARAALTKHQKEQA